MEFFITELTLSLLKEKFESFCHSMAGLKVVENPNLEKFINTFEASKSYSKTFVVIEKESGDIVGSVRGLLDYKFLRGGSIGGRIEEVSVNPKYQGNGLGSLLMQYVLEYLNGEGCYKIELACDQKLAPFYEKFGFQGLEVEMKMYT
ncbi:GNAT family N-acetyltransferase [Candidatus Gracilibacteria bacterium]|nr:GNAT family N-acetyltransferase [Candidatus Gracilibacteria bacterium]NUJ98786.1 GNAT family N-acetyltransferase [Candidatus Gracilibacteria bacterium]